MCIRDRDVVTAVLDAVTVPASGSGDDRRIEASLLQLVMQRLWVAGRDESDRLQASTLQRLRGPEHIIDGYVDGIIDDLPPSDRGVAESVLSRLVTGSGFRTALPAVDLVGTSSGTHDAVMSVLKQLSSGDVRLLHRFPQPDNPTQQLYEVSHDKLADAIVKRRERLRREAATRRRKRLAAPLTWAIAVAVVATTVALSAYAAERVDWHDVFLGGLVVAAASWIVAAALWFRSRKTGPPA